MKSLMEELKNNFKIVELEYIPDNCIRMTTEWFDTHDKAVDAVVRNLKDKGPEVIYLPYLPVPYIINDREGNHQGVVSFTSVA